MQEHEGAGRGRGRGGCRYVMRASNQSPKRCVEDAGWISNSLLDAEPDPLVACEMLGD